MLIAIIFRLGVFTAQKYWSERLDEGVVIVMVSGGATLALLPVSLVILNTTPVTFTQSGLAWLLVSSTANAIAIIALILALDTGDLSIVGPLTSLGPLITAIVEPLVRAIVLPLNVLLGAVVTVIGAIVLSSDTNTTQNIKQSLKQKSAVLSLLVSFLYGISSMADAAGTQHIHPVIFSNLILVTMTIGGLIFMQYKHDSMIEPWKTITPRTILTAGSILGIFQAAKMYWLFYGFSIAPSGTHVTILLQLANIGIVIIGWVMFNEKHLLRRIIGTLIILSGVWIAI